MSSRNRKKQRNKEHMGQPVSMPVAKPSDFVIPLRVLQEAGKPQESGTLLEITAEIPTPGGENDIVSSTAMNCSVQTTDFEEIKDDTSQEADGTKNPEEHKEEFPAVSCLPEQETGKPDLSTDHRKDKSTAMAARMAKVERNTKETQIVLELDLDGTGNSKIDSGIGFFDHMLCSMAKHGFLDMKLSVQGDLIVDGHHTIEDTGIVFGQALREALGDKVGIKRYGSFLLPMDETLVMCAVDLSGRPYLNFAAEFTAERVGYMETELVREFFYAVSYSAGMNLHIKVLDGKNNHHIIEAMFKAFAKALDEAKTVDPRISGVLSTKGVV